MRVNYYGEAFSPSGYGHAARAYIHALHLAGVDVKVVVGKAQATLHEDKLVASLLGQHEDPDHHLFHGIPTFWARRAYKLENVVALTVWEADQIPSVWRNPLEHAIDVWVPSTSNVDAFARSLINAPFCLPHALLPIGEEQVEHLPVELGSDDFIFYSIFEWQARKNPDGLLEAYLREFHGNQSVVLVVKTAPRAREQSAELLALARKRTRSDARIIMICSLWGPQAIDALHTRGDCYVSLHRGEGWGYPLFEAAARGKPVIATKYGGPIDYLNESAHWLIRNHTIPIAEPYFYYTPLMNWAEPDLDHARLAMRWIAANYGQAKGEAELAAAALRRAYSLEHIGAVAKARLVALSERSARPRPQLGAMRLRTFPPIRLSSRESPQRGAKLPRVAPVPIPSTWYDEEYFDQGIKSNWRRGHTWKQFGGLFQATAQLLREVFPRAESFLDAGCAKGFLVRALRDIGIHAFGFDHSLWAIEHSEKSVRQYLCCASVEDVHYPPKYVDVVVAMSLLEGLTEQQILAFLSKAKLWLRDCLFVVIPVQGGYADRDLSHITMHGEAWWRDLFSAAGWAEDPRKQILCEHRLTRSMKWELHVLTPPC